MYEPTEKVALQIHSLQVDANIFKVMGYLYCFVIFFWFLCSLLHCRLQFYCFRGFCLSLSWKYRFLQNVNHAKVQSKTNKYCKFHVDLTRRRLSNSRFKKLGTVPKKLYRNTLSETIFAEQYALCGVFPLKGENHFHENVSRLCLTFLFKRNICSSDSFSQGQPKENKRN